MQTVCTITFALFHHRGKMVCEVNCCITCNTVKSGVAGGIENCKLCPYFLPLPFILCYFDVIAWDQTQTHVAPLSLSTVVSTLSPSSPTFTGWPWFQGILESCPPSPHCVFIGKLLNLWKNTRTNSNTCIYQLTFLSHLFSFSLYVYTYPHIETHFFFLPEPWYFCSDLMFLLWDTSVYISQ